MREAISAWGLTYSMYNHDRSCLKNRLDGIAMATLEVDCAGMSLTARAFLVRLDAHYYESITTDLFSVPESQPIDNLHITRLPCSGERS